MPAVRRQFAPSMHALTFVIIAIVLAASWVTWRLASRRTVLPCPAALSLLVEMENPLARVTRSECVIAQLGLGRGARVADIGCGPGRVSLPLAQTVGPEGEVFAVDLQEAMLAKVNARARDRNIANIRLWPADARAPGLPAGSLDGAVAVMSLGEIPDLPVVFAAVHASLKPGGRFLVAESLFDPHFINRKKLTALAVAAGFTESHAVGNRLAYTIVFIRPMS